MILFINGPFGVGKTSVAIEVHRRLPNSLIFDPEEVGFLLRNTLGQIDPRGDFQEYGLWPILVVEVAKRLKAEYGRDLILPMTLYDLSRFEAIVKGLRHLDFDFRHTCLLASPEVIGRRLLSRGEEPGSWGFAHLAPSLEAFHDPRFENKIDTDMQPLDAIVQRVLTLCNQP